MVAINPHVNTSGAIFLFFLLAAPTFPHQSP